MIREPQDCTRKVVQASSAEIPFTMKVFYDTTRNSVLEIKQQGNSFPLTQRTNQVMTFYTNGTDQYEIYMEMNYDEPKPRQVYMEFLSRDLVTYSGQEKFEGLKFCMRIFANTVLPPTVPTKEEIFGEALDYIAQIPAMVTAFNANSITTATSISYMWMLVLGIFVAVVIIFINSVAGKRKFNSMLRDGQDAVEVVNKSVENIDRLTKTATELLEGIAIKDELQKLPSTHRTVSDSGNIRKKEEKKPKKKLFERFHRKQRELEEDEIIELPTKDDVGKEILDVLSEDNSDVDEILEELSRKDVQDMPTARIIEENIPVSLEKSPDYLLKPLPPRFNEFLSLVDYKKKILKEGGIEKFSYRELNVLYAWISHYRRHMNLLMKEIPKDMLRIQDTAIDLIYNAIMEKMEKKLTDD